MPTLPSDGRAPAGDGNSPIYISDVIIWTIRGTMWCLHHIKEQNDIYCAAHDSRFGSHFAVFLPNLDQYI